MSTSVASNDTPVPSKWRSTAILVAAVAIGAALGVFAARPFGRVALGAGLGVVAGIAASSVVMREKVAQLVGTTRAPQLEALKAYTEGKMERYKLLFAVNGGAFVLGQFMLSAEASQIASVLPLRYLADGAIIYTALMTVDIWFYAQTMRDRFVGDAAFTPAGKALLLLISTLLIGAWFLASASRP